MKYSSIFALSLSSPSLARKPAAGRPAPPLVLPLPTLFFGILPEIIIAFPAFSRVVSVNLKTRSKTFEYVTWSRGFRRDGQEVTKNGCVEFVLNECEERVLMSV